MEEKNIIDMIAEAEEKAAEIIAKAQDVAAAIVTEAQKQAMEITKSTEGICAKRTAEILQKAREDAKAYADEILGHVEPQVADVVGRLVK